MPAKKFTDEQINQALDLLKALDEGGAERRKNFPHFDESDFAAGGFTVMAALGLWELIPAGRVLGLLRGESLKLGPNQKRPTDGERLKHYEKLIESIRESYGWKLSGELVYYSDAFPLGAGGINESLVAWADGYGGYIVGLTPRGYEKDLDRAHSQSIHADEATAAKPFGLEEFPYDD